MCQYLRQEIKRKRTFEVDKSIFILEPEQIQSSEPSHKMLDQNEMKYFVYFEDSFHFGFPNLRAYPFKLLCCWQTFNILYTTFIHLIMSFDDLEEK